MVNLEKEKIFYDLIQQGKILVEDNGNITDVHGKNLLKPLMQSD